MTAKTGARHDPPSASTPDDVDPRALLRAQLPTATVLGFAAALVAIVIVATVSYRSLAARREGADLVQETEAVIGDLAQLLSTVSEAETGQRGYLLTGDPRYLAPYDAALTSLDATLSRLRTAIADEPEMTEPLALAESQTRAKLTELAETIALRRSDRTAEAMALVQSDRGKQLMEQLRTTLGRMGDIARAQLAARTATWEQLIATSTYVTWGGAAVLFVLIAIAAIMTARDFRSQQRQLWLRHADAAISARLAGEQSRAQLGDSIARGLARYVDAQVAAVYAPDATDRLLRIGGYGLGDDTAPETAVTGLARQALRDNTVVQISDVPADYVTVTTGLGATRPRHIVLAPGAIDGAAQAVIELGLLHAPAPHDLELLQRMSEPVGVALRTAKYRDELRALLDETQRQAEELQAQQEELRVQNEELEQQSRALQDSAARMENQQSELEQTNAQLEAQTHSLEQQRAALQRAQREEQRANAYKSEFLANMSHELRTPLNSSLILAKLLLDNREGNLTAEQVKFAQTIYSAGNDLLALINDILDLSKIEAGKLDVRPETVALARLADELADMFTPIAKNRGLELSIAVDDAAPAAIDTDPTRLHQILNNLLSNAFKFTEQGGVTLRVRAAGGRIVFDVRDTGIGIAPEQQGVIFEAFRQADGTTNRKYGGTGLGLSISRDLARLLGGDLTVDSTPGRGSTFTLTLPRVLEVGGAAAPRPTALRPAAPTPAALAPPPEAISRAAAPASPAAPELAAPAPAAPGTPAPRTAAPRPATTAPIDDRDRLGAARRAILVIEDDLAFARILADLAREHEFQTLIAQTAEEGLALAIEHRPSAIVLDVGLPDRSGLVVLDALKRDPATRHIPVHMMSATDYTQAALEMGAIGYAIKPVERKDLDAALHRLESKLSQQHRRVLIVEDDEVLRQSTCRLLEGKDVECVGVGTAADALAQLAGATFDTMVLDLTLPDKTGFELLEEMATQEQRAFPPVIVYTGRSLSREDEHQLRKFSQSIIIKGARSPERLLDEVTLFLHQVEADLPPDRQRMLRNARHRESVFEGRRILIVEDDVRNIFALSSVLEPKGAKVEIARNGREALAHLRDRPGIDLVLMDIMMPEMDGLQAMRAIRKQPELAKLPIIALTAKAMADDRDSCMAAGANDYIAKPLDIDKLLSLARVWIPK
jgi:signal transduction histidine kinase/DNA-binding response OmpR family regulator/CHASE3 domain sensor protein